MADYWKSNPRKFCEVCRCWFGDNKASVEFHERGRRHQENVKKMLSNARKRTTENEKTAQETREMLATIEMAAATAYVKDLGGEISDANPSLLLSSDSTESTTTTAATNLPPTLADNFKVRKAMAHMEILNAIQESQAKKEKEEEELVPPPPPSPWQQTLSPDGHVYYYNLFTRETQWEEPDTFQPLPPELVPKKTASLQPPTVASNYTSTALAGPSWEEEEEERRLAGRRKRADGEEGEGEEDEVEEPRPKRPTGPYGSWTTVAIHERAPDPEPQKAGEEEDKKEEEEEEEGDSESEEEDTRVDKKEKEERVRFKEKTVSSIRARMVVGEEEKKEEEENVTPGSFKGFGFKKRMAERPKIRQRTSELS